MEDHKAKKPTKKQAVQNIKDTTLSGFTTLSPKLSISSSFVNEYIPIKTTGISSNISVVSTASPIIFSSSSKFVFLISPNSCVSGAIFASGDGALLFLLSFPPSFLLTHLLFSSLLYPFLISSQ